MLNPERVFGLKHSLPDGMIFQMTVGAELGIWKLQDFRHAHYDYLLGEKED